VNHHLYICTLYIRGSLHAFVDLFLRICGFWNISSVTTADKSTNRSTPPTDYSSQSDNGHIALTNRSTLSLQPITFCFIIGGGLVLHWLRKEVEGCTIDCKKYGRRSFTLVHCRNWSPQCVNMALTSWVSSLSSNEHEVELRYQGPAQTQNNLLFWCELNSYVKKNIFEV